MMEVIELPPFYKYVPLLLYILCTCYLHKQASLSRQLDRKLHSSSSPSSSSSSMASHEQEHEQQLTTPLDEMPKVIPFLSSLLEKIAETNDPHINQSHHQEEENSSVFQGLLKPNISIQSYLERIFKYANCSPSCFVVAYVYLDRFVQKRHCLLINSFNVHRLLITSVMVAAKFMDDMYYNNAYYAKVGGVSTTEMNILEVDFLFGLKFNLNVTPNTFHTYCSYLQRAMLVESPVRAIESPQNTVKSLKHHSCFNEDESNQHQHQLSV